MTKNELKIYNLETNSMETEKLFSKKFLNWLYFTPSGQTLGHLLCRRPIGEIYGTLQNLKSSKKNIQQFIKDYQINTSDYVKSKSDLKNFKNFNQFFAREFLPGKREFVQNNQLPAFCEGRYLIHQKNNKKINFPVKGINLQLKDLLKSKKYAQEFKNSSIVICRLSPMDYHRFHFLDNLQIIDHYKINGALYSVGKDALKTNQKTFIKNKREITIIESEQFGKCAYIEVGGFCVGTIKQTYQNQNRSFFKRGEQKGYFLFGGSTVILLIKNNKITFNKTILNNTKNNIETLVKLGSKLGALNE